MPITLYNAQTVVAAGGAALLPTSVTLTKSLISLHAKVTSGATAPAAKRGFQIIVSGSPFSITASTAPGLLKPSYVLYCEPSATANGVTYYKSEPIIIEGLSLYSWVSAEELGQNVTLDAQIVEIA